MNMRNNNEEKTERYFKPKYITPAMEVILVELEEGIAAGSGRALPASSSTPVNETWDNADVTPDQPINW
ncbi:hypothetical protein [Pedobacter cryoconitis]|uniref:Uncharacterized protein n=1 Tax=Pedobacter cryoconitis TaxID=188932 RepID=A0A7X0J511_9SPHI|nr:hypothetical protein [Pedobacter cryoconitis]MBB6500993.1 hypothetical protein [Pedobacter cryoconitis]